jgi:hypothetical protein
MRRSLFAVAVVAASMIIAAVTGEWSEAQEGKPASPVYGVTLPDGFRAWQLIAPALEGEPLNELRAVVGNPIAVEAYRAGKLPFPDGAVLVKLAWTLVPSPEFAPASVPGAATTVQVMVKDTAKYASSGADPLRLLGLHGLHANRRHGRRHRADPAFSASSLCHVVPHQADSRYFS